jgi:aminoglycoside phosphotransferase (APT) family kinase protein
VQSKGERQIADWLHAHGIEYRYDDKFQIIQGFVVRPDFYLPRLDLYIEYWGVDTTDYKIGMLLKQKLYQQQGKRLLSVYPADLPGLDAKLTAALQPQPRRDEPRESSCQTRPAIGQAQAAQSRPPPQGKNNRVLRVIHEGRPAIAKFYHLDSPSPVPPTMRRRRELTFLQRAAATGVVPAVVAVRADSLLLEELPGQPLDAWLRERSLRSAPAGTTKAIGEAHRQLLTLPLNDVELAVVERDCFEGATLEQRITRLLAEARGWAHFAPDSLPVIEAALPELLAGPRMLYKFDNNLGNVLVDERGGFVGLIDFEQCYLGTRWLYLGAVYDCAHALPWDRQAAPVVYQQLPWPALAAGLGVEGTPRLVVLAAMLNHWQRVAGWRPAAADAAWWANRFTARFQEYQRALRANP